MEVVYDEISGPSLVGTLVCTVGANAEQEVVSVLQVDVYLHSLHVLCGGTVEPACMPCKVSVIVGIIYVVISRETVAIVRLRRPIADIAVRAVTLGGK